MTEPQPDAVPTAATPAFPPAAAPVLPAAAAAAPAVAPAVDLAAAPAAAPAWATTTHVWADAVDHEHLDDVRAREEVLARGGAVHLVLEILAYAAEESASSGVRGTALVEVGPSWIRVVDDGRGTEIRRDDAGHVVRKPVMATRDVRWFDAERPPLLADGNPRRGASVVAALCECLVHENRRAEGRWIQEYRYGVPVAELTELDGDGRTGTSVWFALRSPLTPAEIEWLEALVADVGEIDVVVVRVGPDGGDGGAAGPDDGGAA